MAADDAVGETDSKPLSFVGRVRRDNRVTIPDALVSAMGLKANDLVQVEIKKVKAQ